MESEYKQSPSTSNNVQPIASTPEQEMEKQEEAPASGCFFSWPWRKPERAVRRDIGKKIEAYCRNIGH